MERDLRGVLKSSILLKGFFLKNYYQIWETKNDADESDQVLVNIQISKIIFKLTVSAVFQVGFRTNLPSLEIMHRGRSQSKSRLIRSPATNFNLCILIAHKLFLCQLK